MKKIVLLALATLSLQAARNRLIDDTYFVNPTKPQLAKLNNRRMASAAQIFDLESGKLQHTLAHEMPAKENKPVDPEIAKLPKEEQERIAKFMEEMEQHQSAVKQIAFNPQGTKLITLALRTAKVWDTSSGKELFKLELPEPTEQGPSAKFEKNVPQFSTDGSKLALLVESPAKDGNPFSGDKTVQLFDAQTGAKLTAIPVKSGMGNTLALNNDGSKLATTVTDTDSDTAIIWDTATGKEILTIKHDGKVVHDAFFSPDGSKVVTISLKQDPKSKDFDFSRVLKVWNVADGKLLFETDDAFFAAEFSNDSSKLLIGGDNTTLYDVATGKKLATLEKLKDTMTLGSTFNSAGTTVLTRGRSGEEFFASSWDAQTGKLNLTIKPASTWLTQFSHDGTKILTGGEKKLQVWDAKDGKLLATHAINFDE